MRVFKTALLHKAANSFNPMVVEIDMITAAPVLIYFFG